MKYKDLSHFNLGLLPADAAAYRGWKNSLLTQMQRYDCSADNHLISWITLALSARGKAAKSLRADSGLLPRLDKLIAAEIMVAKTLNSAGDLALEMQAYVEECSLEGAPPRGRYMLNMVSRSFDMDRRRGSMLTEMQILSIDLPGYSIANLQTFRSKVLFAIGAVPVADRPSESLLGQWLFQRLRGCKRLEKSIDRFKASALSSKLRLFPFLFQKLKEVIEESKEDVNAASVNAALAGGPAVQPQAPTKKEAKAAVAAAAAAAAAAGAAGGAKGGKGGKAAGAAKDKKKDAKGKGKGKGDNKGKAAGAAGAAQTPPIKPGTRSALTPEQKAKTPCIFHPHGTCRMAASCPFLHETVINNKTGKGAGKAPGGVAAVLGLRSAVPATIAVVVEAARRNLVPASAGRPRARRTLAWIEDSGAGRNLASVRALVEQGFARSEVESLLRKTKDPVDFETGGGTQPSARTIGIAPVSSHCSSSTYMLPDCPVVRSMGLTVLEEQRAFIWDPRTSKPYYAMDLSKLQIICPESNRYYAHEVRENVPHFRSQVVLTPGLPATRAHRRLIHRTTASVCCRKAQIRGVCCRAAQTKMRMRGARLLAPRRNRMKGKSFWWKLLTPTPKMTRRKRSPRGITSHTSQNQNFAKCV